MIWCLDFAFNSVFGQNSELTQHEINPGSNTRRNWLILNGRALPLYWNWICMILRLDILPDHQECHQVNKTLVHLCTWAKPKSQFGNCWSLFHNVYMYLLQPFEHVIIARCTWCTIVVSTVRWYGFVLFPEENAMWHCTWFVSICAWSNQNQELVSKCNPKAFINCDQSFCYSHKCQIPCVKEKMS
jgi:hypothetical protein